MFVTRIVFVKKLGVEYLGINGLFSNVLQILSLADLGLATALMYSLYEPLANNDTEKMQRRTVNFEHTHTTDPCGL